MLIRPRNPRDSPSVASLQRTALGAVMQTAIAKSHPLATNSAWIVCPWLRLVVCSQVKVCGRFWWLCPCCFISTHHIDIDNDSTLLYNHKTSLLSVGHTDCTSFFCPHVNGVVWGSAEEMRFGFSASRPLIPLG